MFVLQRRPDVLPYLPPVCVSTVEDRVSHLCSLCPGCHLLHLSCCKCLGARFPPTTGSRALARVRVKSNRGRRSNHRSKISNSPMSRLRCAVEKEMQHNVLFWHCDGLMQCRDESVSTVVCMCHCVSLCVYKTQHLLPRNILLVHLTFLSTVHPNLSQPFLLFLFGFSCSLFCTKCCFSLPVVTLFSPSFSVCQKAIAFKILTPPEQFIAVRPLNLSSQRIHVFVCWLMALSEQANSVSYFLRLIHGTSVHKNL